MKRRMRTSMKTGKEPMEVTEKEIQYDIYQPFGPSILKVNMPQEYVNLLNVHFKLDGPVKGINA